MDLPAEPPEPTQRPPATPRRRRLRRLIWVLGTLFLLGVLAFSGPGSWASARLLARYVGGVTFVVDSGPSPRPGIPGIGPFDVRLGYAELPRLIPRLTEAGFRVTAQATVSERLDALARRGLYPPYAEKTQAGLRLTGRSRMRIATRLNPPWVYASPDQIPDPVRETLLFLENRELLDDRDPYKNPAIEWDRLVAAVANFAGARVLGGDGRFGASTLATQLEKLRHSRDGITRTAGDKARQMASATLRAYRTGPRTAEVRPRILTDYLNALPVGALPGYGEVIGLRDGLRTWFGLDPDSADAWLRTAATKADPQDAARAYRGVLMLLLAQRRPAYYLQTPAGREALSALTDAHLRILEDQAAVPAALIRAAQEIDLPIRSEAPEGPRISFIERKAVNAVRSHLANLLEVQSLYALDRFDLDATTTIDGQAQAAATQLIRSLAEPTFIHTNGLEDDRLLGNRDPHQVAYSLVLYERTPLGNAVRVQVDNLDRPFDLNSGARLELGSTAKLRTLVTYLELMEALYGELTDTTSGGGAAASANDPMTQWAREYLASHPGLGVSAFLAASMERRYSASPAETFFTGGGIHTFGNFDNTHDHEIPTVAVGFRYSINLVFVRMMRDIVRFHEQRLPGFAPDLLENPNHPSRRTILERYVEEEGHSLIERAFRRHQPLSRDSSVALLAGSRITPARMARTLLAIDPRLSVDDLDSLVTMEFPDAGPLRSEIERVRRGMPPELGLADRAYLSGTEPLELWVVSRLREDPARELRTLQTESAEAKAEAFAWLYSTTPAVRRAQDRAIRITLEREAFREVLTSWARVGYPYPNIVPSLGTSIGSSGDRPGALGDLVGILLSGGVRRPVVRVEALHFAADTPFEVSLQRDSLPGQRVLSPAVSAVARAALRDVVSQGSASLLRGALRRADGSEIEIGGKTGTGRNEIRTFARGGREISSQVRNRTATFVFYIGDRFFGVATAYVDGPAAELHQFTSGLPVRVVRLLLPRLGGLLVE